MHALVQLLSFGVHPKVSREQGFGAGAIVTVRAQMVLLCALLVAAARTARRIQATHLVDCSHL
jgi:hypothetical protein